PCTVRSTCSSPSRPRVATATGRSTGVLRIALTTRRVPPSPARTSSGAARPTLTVSSFGMMARSRPCAGQAGERLPDQLGARRDDAAFPVTAVGPECFEHLDLDRAPRRVAAVAVVGEPVVGPHRANHTHRLPGAVLRIGE